GGRAGGLWSGGGSGLGLSLRLGLSLGSSLSRFGSGSRRLGRGRLPALQVGLDVAASDPASLAGPFDLRQVDVVLSDELAHNRRQEAGLRAGAVAVGGGRLGWSLGSGRLGLGGGSGGGSGRRFRGGRRLGFGGRGRFGFGRGCRFFDSRLRF